MIAAKVQFYDRCSRERRYSIASRVIPAAPFLARFLARFLAIVCDNWRTENALQWVPGATFKGDQSRLRKGQGAAGMAAVRDFAQNLARAVNDKRSIERRRKRAAWAGACLSQILGLNPR
ncbi:MAG: hypothetical protein ACREDA_12885 [Methylocella sp.]